MLIEILALACDANAMTFPMASCRPTAARSVYGESPRMGPLHVHREHIGLPHENVAWACIIFSQRDLCRSK